jgi:hypothetical protein
MDDELDGMFVLEVCDGNCLITSPYRGVCAAGLSVDHSSLASERSSAAQRLRDTASPSG